MINLTGTNPMQMGSKNIPDSYLTRERLAGGGIECTALVSQETEIKDADMIYWQPNKHYEPIPYKVVAVSERRPSKGEWPEKETHMDFVKFTCVLV